MMHSGWVICAQLEHSMSVEDKSVVSPGSWPLSPQMEHTADNGSPGWWGRVGGVREGRGVTGNQGVARRRLTAKHCRSTQVCFSRPGPPNFLMSLQKLQSPHSVRRQASQRLQRTRLRRIAEMDEGGLTGRGGGGGPWGSDDRRGRFSMEGGGGGGWYQEGCRP